MEKVTVAMLDEVRQSIERYALEDLAREIVGAGPNIKVRFDIRITDDVPGSVLLGQKRIEIPANTLAFIISGQYPQYCTAVTVRRTGRRDTDAERLVRECRRQMASRLRGSDGSWS